jgi:ribosomal protein S18 acetylase RimI-like enzyme
MMLDIAQLPREAESPVEAGAADLPGVIGDLDAAFADDVMFDWFLRDDHRRDTGRRGFFNALIRHVAFGTARIERPASGGAAAVWMPPEATGPISLLKEVRVAPAILGATGLARVPRILALQSAIDAHHPKNRPYAYLWFLGVRPEAQGMGVGSRLLRVATRRLDASGLPAYLETQTRRNVALYRRHGFEVTAEFHPRADSPPMWGMWREPQTDIL